MRDGGLEYLGNRSDHEYVFPPQQEFEWKRAHRDMQRHGEHPHVSIEDRLFVETIGGDLTIKIEDNTDSGEGIYSEDVTERDQTLDDAEIHYAVVGSLILLKILPYQEKDYRFLVYNEKIQRVFQVPAIQDSCVLLPDDHGLDFRQRVFAANRRDQALRQRTARYALRATHSIPQWRRHDVRVLQQAFTGDYVLLSYNIITQTVETPVVCNGYTLFPNGELLYFKTEEQPQKHHVIQIWQTPFVGEDAAAAQAADTKSYLFKVGNADIVRCMAECQEILALLGKDDSFAGLYLDLVKRTGDVIDSYFWLGREEALKLKEPLSEINGAAQAAIAEFDKVVRLRKSTAEEMNRVAKKAKEVVSKAEHTRPDDIMGFVHVLADLREVRGEIISLRDLRYIDLPRVDEMEGKAEEATNKVSEQCVAFLETPEALDPYRKRVSDQEAEIAKVKKVVEAEEIETALNESGGELDMLIDIVSNLKIDDATKTTQIIDDISSIYAQLNQVKVALKNKKKELSREEGVAQFNAQLKLLNQAVVNYLDLCDTPEKCDEFLTKTMIQLEELEGQFSEFDEYIEQLAEKRDELYNAFESKKLSLTEARNRRANTLLKSGERILAGVRHRVQQFESINEINGYFAGDLMVEKIRDIGEGLKELGDSVKADDLQTQVKTIRDEAVRQLKDRQELYVDGENIIKFGEHRFSVNTQELEMTVVPQDDEMCFHLTGTDFFEPIEDARFLETKDVWSQVVVSENRGVYRAEYLAFQYFRANRESTSATAEDVQRFMGPRYSEGYTKGVHDQDALKILEVLLAVHQEIGLLRYSSRGRALGLLFWEAWDDMDAKATLEAKLLAFGGMRDTFGQKDSGQEDYIAELEALILAFDGADGLLVEEAAEYLFFELSAPTEFTVAQEAADLVHHFRTEVTAKRAEKRFEEALASLEGSPVARYAAILDWVRGFLATGHEAEIEDGYAEEAAAHLLRGGFRKRDVLSVRAYQEIEGLSGTHAVIGEGGLYQFHYNTFLEKLRRFEAEVVPRFESYAEIKTELIEEKRDDLRLEEFKPQVMSAFVRNQLLDKVYLPLIGANLAKQLGTAGADTRTDRMGLLLLISPPGYGKTTVMEYIANRLGITFMKINGPALGHKVTSLDPQEAPNASAREEVDKLNLALEMGDNVLIYVDDIQHCNPEFLQKFISLCDAQRKMEGVWRGKAQTYDLRGKKVAVVMAGNPYTESGGKFQIPDMLANRADTYNLGDIVGGNASAFRASYIENSLTSNPVLSKLGARSQKDVYAIMKIAETGSQEGVDFEGNYSIEEVEELTNVMKKLFRVRDTILRVNLQYIASAAQQDDYRTEPPFKLQGSYRNMNRIAERIQPIMTDDEVLGLILGHYENEAQNLTTGAEANLLKFREMEGLLTEEEAERWDDIKKTFRRNLLTGGAGENDPVSRVVGQLASFGRGLDDIRDVLEKALNGSAVKKATTKKKAPAKKSLSKKQKS